MIQGKHSTYHRGKRALATALITVTLAAGHPARGDKTIQLDGVSRGRADIIHRDGLTRIRVSDNAVRLMH